MNAGEVTKDAGKEAGKEAALEGGSSNTNT